MPKLKLNLLHLSALLLLGAMLCLTLTGIEIAKRYQKPAVEKTKPFAQQVSHTQLQPEKLIIGSLGLEVPISTSSKIWEEHAKTAVYFAKTPLPGKKGNSVIYGHNWPNVLGKLTQIQTGQTITIEFSDGSTDEFTVIQKVNVTADQTHILAPTDDYRLTLYTCSGVLDTKRLVIVATKNLKSVAL